MTFTIDTFINSIFIYDDRIIIFYNIRGGKQISYLDMLDATKGVPDFDIPDAEKGMESIRILNDSVRRLSQLKKHSIDWWIEQIKEEKLKSCLAIFKLKSSGMKSRGK